ncbi:hypothetical protein AWB77_06304 [Caballeronia fortuita]|uniref:Uncharacterized protein n=1 Tax=Caballeronia fortuita TaxID=1777138 RepID=A0A158E5N7_9BURK|nr:hypothetical protein [Caballeronia fortuita]SAL01237.1 hypothetical protein AWB77_06304 [Caballeronia fortuita]
MDNKKNEDLSTQGGRKASKYAVAFATAAIAALVGVAFTWTPDKKAEDGSRQHQETTQQNRPVATNFMYHQ